VDPADFHADDVPMTPRAVVRSQRIRAVVESESETALGWTFAITLRDGERESSHIVTMSFRDHDYWCSGSIAPSRVVAAVVEYVAQHWQGTLPPKFDASTARRWTPHVDRELQERL
jgi:hypothetical protein